MQSEFYFLVKFFYTVHGSIVIVYLCINPEKISIACMTLNVPSRSVGVFETFYLDFHSSA